MLILMVELKVCRWRRASARGSGERSEPAAGRPRKEQAPKAPSRIASNSIFVNSKPIDDTTYLVHPALRLLCLISILSRHLHSSFLRLGLACVEIFTWIVLYVE